MSAICLADPGHNWLTVGDEGATVGEAGAVRYERAALRTLLWSATVRHAA